MTEPIPAFLTAQAVVCRERHGPLRVETVRVAPPRADEVMLRMAAVGVCHSDLSATDGTLDAPLPLVLGHEGAGIVTAVGPAVRGLAVGDHVITSFVSMCGRCRHCQSGRPHLCGQAGRAAWTLPDGSTRYTDAHGRALGVFSGCGVMSEVATLHADNVVKIRRDIPLDRAALVGCAVMTGVGAAINTARVEAGSTALVIGCGGVGLSAIQGCRIAGAAMIVALDTQDGKLEMARQFGATHTLNSSRHAELAHTLRQMSDGGVDYAFDCVGQGGLAALAFAALRKGGTAVMVGVAPATDTTTVPSNALTLEEKTLTGSHYGSARPRQDFPRLIGLYQSGRLMLDEMITRRYTLAQAPEAFDDLVTGRNARGVIVFDEVLRRARQTAGADD